MSATFLDERGRPGAVVIVLVGVGEPGEPEKKRARVWTAGDMVLEGTFVHEFSMFQVSFLMIWHAFADLCQRGAPRREMT